MALFGLLFCTAGRLTFIFNLQNNAYFEKKTNNDQSKAMSRNYRNQAEQFDITVDNEVSLGVIEIICDYSQAE